MSDPNETTFSLLTTKKAPTLADPGQVDGAQDLPAATQGLDLEETCLAFIGFEGPAPRQRAAQGGRTDRLPPRRAVHRLRPGELYDQKKFDTPYIRDYLLDRGVLADVSETSAPWGSLPALYDERRRPRPRRFSTLGVRG